MQCTQQKVLLFCVNSPSAKTNEGLLVFLFSFQLGILKRKQISTQTKNVKRIQNSTCMHRQLVNVLRGFGHK